MALIFPWGPIVFTLTKKWRHFWRAVTLYFHFMGGYPKLDRVKTMGTRGKINAIRWDIKINLQKIGRYNWTWIAQNVLTEVKIFQKVSGGYFLKHLVHTMSYIREQRRRPEIRNYFGLGSDGSFAAISYFVPIRGGHTICSRFFVSIKRVPV